MHPLARVLLGVSQEFVRRHYDGTIYIPGSAAESRVQPEARDKVVLKQTRLLLPGGH